MDIGVPVRIQNSISELQSQNVWGFYPGHSSFFINSREFVIKTLTPFKLFESLQREASVFDSLSSILRGLVTSEPQEGSPQKVSEVAKRLLTSQPMAPEPQAIDPSHNGPISDTETQTNAETRFVIPTTHVTWFNNIETDDVYQDQWPPQMTELLHPPVYGKPRFPRRNLFNTILILDPSHVSGLAAASDLMDLLDDRYPRPIRLGLMLVSLDAVRQFIKQQVKADLEMDPSAALTHQEESDPGHRSSAVSISSTSVVARIVAIFMDWARADVRRALSFLVRLYHAAGKEKAKSKTITLEQFNSAYMDMVQSSNMPPAAAPPTYLTESSRLAATFMGPATTSTHAHTTADDESLPVMVMNGIWHRLAPETSFREEALFLIRREEAYLRHLAKTKALTDAVPDVWQYLLDRSKAQPRFVPALFQDRPTFPRFSEYQAVLQNVAFISNDFNRTSAITHLLVANLGSIEGVFAMMHALQRVRKSTAARAVRLGLVECAKDQASVALEALLQATTDRAHLPAVLWRYLQLLHATYKVGAPFQLDYITDSLAAMNNDCAQAASQTPNSENRAGDAHIATPSADPTQCRKIDMDKFRNLCGELGDGDASIRQLLASRHEFFHHVSARTQPPLLLTNGRLIHLGRDGHGLFSNDYVLLEDFEATHRINGVVQTLRETTLLKEDTEESNEQTQREIAARAKSNILFLLCHQLSHDWFHHGPRREHLPPLLTQDSAKTIGFVADPRNPSASFIFDVLAVINPISSETHKAASYLRTLDELFDSHVSVYFNPADETEEKGSSHECPTCSFYRYVLDADSGFLSSSTRSGKLIPAVTAKAIFKDLPEDRDYKLVLFHPHMWVVSLKSASVDPNFISGSASPSHVSIDYSLDHLLITGHCINAATKRALYGLEVIMANSLGHESSRTLATSPDGYFQIPALPGLWQLLYNSSSPEKIRQQRQADVYIEDDFLIQIAIFHIDSYHALDLTLELPSSAIPKASLENPFPSLWKSMWSMVFGSRQTETVNIFSVAAGADYEHMLLVMMSSVMRHTSAPVRFWLLRDFLSPSFRAALPRIAAELKCSVELVSYKWPKWLPHQSHLTRVIWAHKVLFLDVLFPANVSRIVYLDADQVVQTDIASLYSMDLHGRSFALTPFCDSRADMEGFRFWKLGDFWPKVLKGKPYHISAMFVADLAILRRSAVMGHLRDVYIGLSADPNSLSNLDQDVLNYAQDRVPMLSLPTEWLWCETWCDDSSKPQAKIIDMCNNPQTKESKLTAAARIVPDWTAYNARATELKEKYISVKSEK